ncbi:MAG TPA: DUF4339 domain-containing protein [Polyangiaceae bacterium]|jgi:hypothetical protein
MSGLHEVACGTCGKRHVMSAARARAQRVLRCECGQFVRLDRALPEERRSDPAPAPPGELAEAYDDEETHMFSSLEEIAAMRSSPRVSDVRASIYDEDDAATRVASSASQLPALRGPRAPMRSIPPPPDAPPRRPSSPAQAAVTPGTDKPLWYVDLGGTETVEMTIEQLIIARRSGRLGEGALVWRAGMPEWRPVGTLIPAGSGPQTAPPPAPERNKPALPNALASYEKPAKTLEFALEKSESSAPRARPLPATPPAPPRRSSRPAPPGRPPTPIPRAPAAVAQEPAPTADARAQPESVAKLDPTNARAEVPSTPPRAAITAMPLLGRASPAPPARSSPFAALHYPWRAQPRWVSVGIAVLVFIAASGSGAFVVRTLKLRREPLSLATTQLSATPLAVKPAPESAPAPASPAESAGATSVVDVDSLSVEHRAPRVQWKPAAAGAAATPPNAPSMPPNKTSENTGADGDSTPAPAAAQTAARKAKSADLPAAAHANPYTTGNDDGATKKPGSPNGDDPGF